MLDPSSTPSATAVRKHFFSDQPVRSSGPVTPLFRDRPLDLPDGAVSRSALWQPIFLRGSVPLRFDTKLRVPNSRASARSRVRISLVAPDLKQAVKREAEEDWAR